MRARAALLGCVLAIVLLGLEGASRANGRFPASSMLVARPGDPSHLVLRSTYGLLLSPDGGASWDWVCERAVGYGGSEDPSVIVAGSGAILVGTFRGTSRSIDGGCHWQREESWPTSVIDLALRPSAPDRIYALTCVYSGVADAGGTLFRSALLVSEDAGEHWSTRATFDPTLLLDSVEVAPGAPGRVYVSAIRPRGRDTSGVLLVSDDDGSHWTERPIPFVASDRGVYIAAVDATRESRVYLRTSGIDASRLFVADDGGRQLREVLHGGPMQGFALSADGSTIFAGGPKDGLRRASASDLRFETRSPTPIQCLTSVAGALWACTPTATGFVLGASLDDGATFAPKLTLAGMRGPLQCAEPSAIDACAPDWTALQSLVRLPRESPSAVPPPAPSAAPVPSASSGARRASCACDVPGPPDGRAHDADVLICVALAFLGRGRRRWYASRP